MKTDVKSFKSSLKDLIDLDNNLKFDINQDLLSDYLKGIHSLIKICGDDPHRDGLLDTPLRFLKAFQEYTSGYMEDPKEHLKKTFDIQHDDIILIKDIEFQSTCEHHLAPFFGKAHIAYIPSNKITGLSKFARLVDGYSRRFQVQERLTQQINDAIVEILNPKGSIVYLQAKHMCVCGRGVRKVDSYTITKKSYGLFSEQNEYIREFYDLLNT